MPRYWNSNSQFMSMRESESHQLMDGAIHTLTFEHHRKLFNSLIKIQKYQI